MNEVGGPWRACQSKSHPGRVFLFNRDTGERYWKPVASDCKGKSSKNTAKKECPPTKMISSSKILRKDVKRKSEVAEKTDEATRPSKKKKKAASATHMLSSSAENPSETKDNVNLAEVDKTSIPSTPSTSGERSRVSLTTTEGEPPRLTEELIGNVYGKQGGNEKAEVVPAVGPSPQSIKTWLTTVPFGESNPSMKPKVEDPQKHNEKKISEVPKNVAIRKGKGKANRLVHYEASVNPRLNDDKLQTPYNFPGTRRKSGGLAEERLRKLRNTLSVEGKNKVAETEPPANPLPIVGPPRRRSLLPTPPHYMRIDCQSQSSEFRKQADPTANRTTDYIFKSGTQPRNFAGEISNNRILPPENVEAEAMDIDDEALVISDIKALRTTVTWESIDVETTVATEILSVSSETKADIIIVLDTNILLSHLSFVKELRDKSKIRGSDLILYVPWIVMQELDKLKETARTSRKARAAIIFLNESFASQHPRVRGQTCREASASRNDHVQELCPDDRILESCSQLKKRGFEIILLSNDVSLCNKALVSHIKAVTKVQLTNDIWIGADTKKIVYSDKSPSPEKRRSLMDRLRKSTSSAPQTKTIKPEANQASEIENLKKILYDTFSKVISTGMEDLYGNVWASRVLHKPPWEMHHVLSCISHHWFALCDTQAPEAVKKATNQLKSIFQKGAKGDSVDQIIDLAVEITARITPKYDLIIRDFHLKIKNLQSSSSVPPAQNRHISDQSCQPKETIPPDCGIVLSYFNELWNIVHPFCLDLKNKVEQGVAVDCYTRDRSREMLNGLEDLVHHIRNILALQLNEFTIMHSCVEGLFDILRSLTPPKGAGNLRLEHVFKFCTDPQSRSILENGLAQLAECGNFLVSLLEG